jgi:hypothetical protein
VNPPSGERSLSAPLLVGIAIAAFSAPVAIRLSYSARIASAGGPTAFVEAGAGRGIAYAISALVLLRVTAAAAVLLVAAAGQLVLLLALGVVELANAPQPVGSLAPHIGAGPLFDGALGLSLLFVRASLPLFFGGEVRGGTRAMRAAILTASCVVSAHLLVVAIPFAQMPPEPRSAEIPGMAIADAYSSHTLAVAIGLGTVVSIVGLIIIEFLALGRVAHHVLGVPVRAALAVIAAAFIAADVISLVDPEGIYEGLLRPALIALFIAQAIVFCVYPLYRRALDRRGWIAPSMAAALAAALMLYGLYSSITDRLFT